MNKEVEILVIGAGPAGLSAAIEAAKYGDLFEQMGIKLPKEALDNNAKKEIKNMR